jgi:Family of unknown function (DUF6325)
MTLGPLEYTVIGFEGNKFDGSIANEIARVVESGTIALVDLVLVTKDVGGDVAIVELDNKDDDRFASFTPMLSGLMGLLTEEDIAKIAERLSPDTSALIIMFEHRWAVHIKDAVAAKGGFLVERETIRPEALEMLNAELEAAAQPA